ncbi:MAG: insulinase family protein [Gammaproteobacteria bacterium]|nr:insulinase family protein [Gammaproteobacteria bacterium]
MATEVSISSGGSPLKTAGGSLSGTAEGAAEGSGFELQQSRRIDRLNLSIHEFTHQATGASHYHLESDHAENVFMVALRTVPTDSTGVAHILEHTALCGSERFPVRDPFFLMIRRSLNTFMNAFTTSDYTAYPFASQNRKDFFNLMDIYLDAVFFSRLDKLDFAQEGHRLEFDDPKDDSTPLVYRGVVYNEMKGDSSSPISVLYSELQKHLFPTVTYHYNSGGDPKHIPELKYEQLIDFYRSHYHPRNAVFMTFGDIPVAELHKFINDSLQRANDSFNRSHEIIKVEPEKRLTKPVRVSAAYAMDQEPTTRKTHIVLAWLLGENTDLEMLLKCNILSDVLLDTSASPLKQALEEFEFAAAASPLCGLEETNHEMSFMCGVEGCDPEHADEVERIILEALQKVSEEGIEIARLEAVLHQLELSQREVGGDGMPYGLQLIFSCMSAAIHRGSPIDLLDLDPVIEKLRAEIQDPSFVKSLVSDLLLKNQHRVRLVMYPDLDFSDRQTKEERARLEIIRSGLSQTQKEEIVTQAMALQARQQEEENVDVLPKVGLSDIPDSLNVPVGKSHGRKGITSYDAGTNGIVYHQVIIEIPDLPLYTLNLLPLFSQVLTEIGSGKRDYLQTQLLQHAITGGLSAYSTIRADHHNPEQFKACFTVSSRTLNSKAIHMFELLKETTQESRFDELDRIRDLVKQIRVRKEANIAGNGHTYALTAAGSCFRPVPWLNHQLTGLQAIENLKLLDDSLDDAGNLKEFCRNLESLRDKFSGASRQFLIVSEGNEIDRLVPALDFIWKKSAPTTTPLRIDFTQQLVCRAYLTSTPVNYCASVFPTVAEDHEDSAALSVLATVLRNGFLHHAVREQGGAYGGGATHDAANGLFRFYSYRDPRLNETFDSFKQSVAWIVEGNVGFSLVEEAILGIVSTIDAPASPAGEARQAFHNGLHGRGPEQRRMLRSGILNVDDQDIKRVAEKYLQGEGCLAVVTSDARRKEIEDDFVVVAL